MASCTGRICMGSYGIRSARAARFAPLRPSRPRLQVLPRAVKEPQPSLPYHTACLRLQELLYQASWESDEEAIRHELLQYTTEMKLTLATNVGSLMTLMAFALSWMTGEDPLGGFGLSRDGWGDAATGAGYALPLLLCSVLSRLPAMRSAFPVLADLQDSTRDTVRPLVADMTPSQLLVLACVTVVPAMMLLLPACHGLWGAFGAVVSDDVLQPLGAGLGGVGLAGVGVGGVGAGLGAGVVELGSNLGGGELGVMLRKELGVVLPAVSSAYLTAWVLTRQLDVTAPQVAAIREALTNCDRYFLHAAAERLAERPDLMASLQQQQPRGKQPAPAPALQQRRAEEQLAATTFASMGSGGSMSAEGSWDRGEVAGPSTGGTLQQLGEEMAAAFKTVSVLWLLTRRKAAQLGYVLIALNTAYLGVIWHDTRDLATPATAALLAVMAELLLLVHCPHGWGGKARGQQAE